MSSSFCPAHCIYFPLRFFILCQFLKSRVYFSSACLFVQGVFYSLFNSASGDYHDPRLQQQHNNTTRSFYVLQLRINSHGRLAQSGRAVCLPRRPNRFVGDVLFPLSQAQGPYVSPTPLRTSPTQPTNQLIPYRKSLFPSTMVPCAPPTRYLLLPPTPRPASQRGQEEGPRGAGLGPQGRAPQTRNGGH